MPREFSRHHRVASQILRTLSELLRFEVKDPRLQRMSLTSVDLSRDLSVARVYFSLLDPSEEPADVLEGLERAAGFLRSKLGRALKTRVVPELRFAHDDSAEQGAKISGLIDSALHGDNQD